MNLLFRVIFKNNFLLLLPTLALGTGVYLLSEIFERMDRFLEASTGLWLALAYFVVKLPSIVGQILPAVFLLSAVVQLCLMAKTRETLALQAGGVSMLAIVRSLLICGMFWAGVQFLCAQYVAVSGDTIASRIWQEEVHKRTEQNILLTNIWFFEKNWMISLDSLAPVPRTVEGFTAYKLSPDGLSLEQLIRARSALATPKNWELHDVTIFDPQAYSQQTVPTLVLPLKQDVQSFRHIQPGTDPQKLPIWLLGELIDKLRHSGSNVENLRTVWHMKFAYSASLLIMALVACALVSWRDNTYLAASLALVITFVFYVGFTLSGTLGQKGFLAPVLAAWLPNIIALLLSGAQLYRVTRRH